ncbi:MAG: TonB-dependent receptor [Pseudomonadota bacterium]
MRQVTLKLSAAGLACAYLCAPLVHAQSPETIVIISAPPVSAGPASGQSLRLSGDALTDLPYGRLDEALAATTSFSLFRRLPSQVANPTIQGASLRGIGPNGAGRAAVLLDGAPLNDPFGNWVNWAALAPGSISSVSLQEGARPISGGPGSLSGLISVETAQTEKGLRLQAGVDTLEGVDASFVHGARLGKTDIITFANGGRREGYILVPERQRGPADVNAASYEVAGGVKVARTLRGAWRGAAMLRGFSERRDNGLDGARNDTQGFDGSLRITGGGADISVYGQVRRFSSLFTATDETRTTTRPVLDQFQVPSYAVGTRLTYETRWSKRHETTLIGQLDWRNGETNERFRNLGDGFTRIRTAGGQQLSGGFGIAHKMDVSQTLAVDAGVRFDVLTSRNGMRRETDIASGAILRDDIFDNRTDTVPSGTLGLRYQPLPAWTAKLRGYTGSRQPSLNEYFRPFRVGNDITEANAELDIETLRGLDASLRYEPFAGQFIEISLFHDWLRDVVGNLTVSGAPGGFIAPCGFVPGNGSCRQRGNIERARARGGQVRAGAAFNTRGSLSLSYRYTDSRITNASTTLAGQRFAQVPRHQGALQGRWDMTDALQLSLILRGQTRQFEDDLNLRALNGFVALDTAVKWDITASTALRLTGTNLANSEIEAGRSASGIITRGLPRVVRLSVESRF